MRRPFLLAHLSDLHVRPFGTLSYGVADTALMCRGCVDHILGLSRQPDAVVVTGDLTDGGRPDEYAALRELLAPLRMPLYLMPGNHDERSALRAAFADHAYLRQSRDFIQYAIDEHPLRIVALDTVVPGESGGALCAERLEWLERTLSEAQRKPTVVLMHHPPFRTFIERMDDFGLREPALLAAVIARHPQVETILCGHVHRAVEARFAGVPARIAPSPVHQIALDLGEATPLRFVMEPPGYRLHAYSSETGLVSHVVYVGEYAAPYLFRSPA